jgi:hypothetical protein
MEGVSLFGLFVASFLSATVLPGSSEVVFVTMLLHEAASKLDDAMGRHRSATHSAELRHLFWVDFYQFVDYLARAYWRTSTLGWYFASDLLDSVAWRCRLFSRWLAQNEPNIIDCLSCHRKIYQILVTNVGSQLTLRLDCC